LETLGPLTKQGLSRRVEFEHSLRGTIHRERRLGGGFKEDARFAFHVAQTLIVLLEFLL